MASVILTMIITGYITTSDQIPGTVDERDWHLVAATCHLENGENGDLCILLTGSVVINRKLYCVQLPVTSRQQKRRHRQRADAARIKVA